MRIRAEKRFYKLKRVGEGSICQLGDERDKVESTAPLCFRMIVGYKSIKLIYFPHKEVR